MPYNCKSGGGGAGNSSNEKTNSLRSHEDNRICIRDPKPLDYLFEKELINKQNKHIYVVDDFVPSRSTHYLTGKFYALYEQYVPPRQFHYRSFVEKPEIMQHRSENNVYGWMPPRLKGPSSAHFLNQLNIVSAPKRRCCLTVYGEKLQSDRVTARPPFNGLRFYLQ